MVFPSYETAEKTEKAKSRERETGSGGHLHSDEMVDFLLVLVEEEGKIVGDERQVGGRERGVAGLVLLLVLER